MGSRPEVSTAEQSPSLPQGAWMVNPDHQFVGLDQVPELIVETSSSSNKEGGSSQYFPGGSLQSEAPTSMELFETSFGKDYFLVEIEIAGVSANHKHVLKLEEADCETLTQTAASARQGSNDNQISVTECKTDPLHDEMKVVVIESDADDSHAEEGSAGPKPTSNVVKSIKTRSSATVEPLKAAISKLKLGFKTQGPKSLLQNKSTCIRETQGKNPPVNVPLTGERPIFQDGATTTTDDRIQNYPLKSASAQQRVDSTNTFPCEHCCLSFKTALARDIHLFSHTHEDLLIKTPVDGSLKKDTQIVPVPNKPFVCPLCQANIPNRVKLTRHMKSEHNSDFIISCRACRCATLSTEEDAIHRASEEHQLAVQRERELTAHKPRTFLCPTCGKGFHSKASFKYHMKVHANPQNKPLVCRICGTFFKQESKSEFDQHVAEHKKCHMFKCQLCPYSTPLIVSFRKHWATHFRAKNLKYHCRQCSEKFEQKCDLVLHVISAHDSSDRFFCLKCNFACPSLSTYKAHQKIHQQNYVHHCSECDYTAKNASSLKQHMEIHMTERRFRCPKCPLAFCGSKQLKDHLNKKHSTSRPFLCSQCPYSGKTRSSLVTHLAVHSDIKAFKCDKCDYSTRFGNNLKIHMARHQDTKPFPCIYCPYGANQKQRLKRHMWAKHKAHLDCSRGVKYDDQVRLDSNVGADTKQD